MVPKVITVSRELGSGGRTIGRKLAAKLNYRYSDKELIHDLQNKFNLTTSGIEKLKGQKKSWFNDFIQLVAPAPQADMLVEADSPYIKEFRADLTTDDIHEAEVEIIKAIASEGPCVIAGRSAFFILQDTPGKVDVFVTASKEHRIERVMAKQGLSREQSIEVIDRVDKQRDNYVQRYTGKTRYDARNYNLVINVDDIDEDDAVDVILDYIAKMK
ncbi:MAG: cytidylate kinase-like family protein [Bacteroidales bacterium]|nr:cytidylate kinase-like family protein [Bacteroidales bacterium]